MEEDFKKNFPNNDISFNIEIENYLLAFNIFGKLVSKDTPKIKKLLEKWTKKFEQNELYFTYKEGIYNENGRMYYWYECIIKTIKIKRVIPPRYIYHTSPGKNRTSIKENGLIPSDSSKWDIRLSYPNAIFASIDKNDIWMSNSDKDIWEIDTKGLDNLWYVDTNVNKTYDTVDNDNFIMTFDAIPKEKIKLVKD
jgi:hypothetical protein